MNAYYVPSKYHEDTFSHEYFYQIKGLNSSGNTVFDTGKNSVIGDGTPKVLAYTWVCDGFDYAYKICLYTDPGLTNGVLQVEGPGYIYEYIEPENMFFDGQFGDFSYEHFLTAHGLTPGMLNDVQTNSAFNYSIIHLNNDFESYRNKYGYLITTDELYAVQKVNWKWPSGSIRVENIADANFFADWTIENVIEYINIQSNIAEVSPNNPVLDCFYFHIGSGGEYEYGDPAIITDCINDGVDNTVFSPDDFYSGQQSIPSLFDIVQNCMETGGVSYLEELDVVDISDINKPYVSVSLSKDDFEDEEGNFVFPPFFLDKGTYWISASFSTGKFFQYYKVVNERMMNSVDDAMLVELSIFEVPIIGDDFSVSITSETNTSILYEVFDHSGTQIFKTELKTSVSDQFILPVDVATGIPSGNVFHKFTFADGSVKIINTIK